MQKGLTHIRPVPLIKGTNAGLEAVRQVLIFNNSGVNLYIGDDEVSANANNGIPILPNTDKSFLWKDELWIGADLDNTEFRYMISARAGHQTSWEELHAQTPCPPRYFNRPIGR